MSHLLEHWLATQGFKFSVWSRRTSALGKFILFLHTSFPKAWGDLSIWLRANLYTKSALWMTFNGWEYLTWALAHTLSLLFNNFRYLEYLTWVLAYTPSLLLTLSWCYPTGLTLVFFSQNSRARVVLLTPRWVALYTFGCALLGIVNRGSVPPGLRISPSQVIFP